MKFLVSGIMDLGDEKRKFTKEVEAGNEAAAKDSAYKVLGSCHGKKRSLIQITGVKKVE